MNDMKTMNIKSTDYRVQITESGSVPGSVLAAIRKASVLCTLCSVLLISSCTHDEITPPVNTTNDALALLPGDTRVGISAEITDNREQSTETRAEGDESATTYYAWNELHETSNLDFVQMLLPGGADGKMNIAKANYGGNLSGLNDAFGLMLKDFNLVPDGTRQVSRWAVMEDAFINSNNVDHLKGAARLTLNAETQQPELNFTLMHSGAKLTVKVVDADGNPMPTTGMTVKATMQGNSYSLIYAEPATPSGYYKHLMSYLQGITSLEADEAVDADKIVWGLEKGSITEEVELKPLVDASGTAVADNTYSNVVSAVVYATPTHTSVKEDGDNMNYYTPIEGGPQFTDADKLTIKVLKDPDGDGPQTTGTYSLKLSEVKLSDTEYLTALEPGKHYTLTVTLRHNTLVAATATIAAWSTTSANANIGGDGAKIYSYDATTKTYTIFEEDGLEAALADRAKNDPDATSTVVMNGVTIVPSGTSLSGIPLKMEDGKLKIVNVPDYIYGDHLPAIIANGSLCVKVDGTCGGKTSGIRDEDINKMKSPIQSAIAKGVTGVYVTGTYLTKVEKGVSGYNIEGPQTVLGMAIREQNVDAGTINVFLPEVETIPDGAFNWCSVIIIQENIVTIPSTNQ